MKVSVKKGRLVEIADHAICFGVFQDQKKLSGELKELDSMLSGSISDILEAGDFSGKLNQITLIYPKAKINSKRVILVGLGKKEKFDTDKIRQAAGTLCKKARELKIKSFSSEVYGGKQRKFSLQDSSQALVEGALLANYQLADYKTVDREDLFEVEEFTIVDGDRVNMPKIQRGAKWGEVFSWGTNLARDLINHPANVINPTKLAQLAVNLSKEHKFKCNVLSLAEIKKLKMGALLGVAQGSNQPPKFIILEHVPKRKRGGTVVLVGKGITFDSGGISLKPSMKMEEMKADMSGAAAVLAAVSGAARLNIPVHLVGLIPSTENLPSGTAQRPGDILTSYSGKTIEVINTDAEGRLILADALAYANKFEPQAVVDIATLTGACIVALGHVGAGMMGNNGNLKRKIMSASQKTGEKLWELPLWEEYDEQIKSDLADVKNTGGRPAGTITAAMFLKKFVGEYPWVHLDIAGMDLEEKGKPYIPKGAVGFGVRLFLQFLRDW
ncbi:MAG: leucyl aminopeptidase [Candidatus Zixiibacteriota bacterium]